MHRLPIFQDSRSFDERTERLIRDVRRQIDEDLQNFGFGRKKLLTTSRMKWDDDDDDDDDGPTSRLLSHDFFKLRPSSLKSPGSKGRVSSPPPRKEDYGRRSGLDDYDDDDDAVDAAKSLYVGRSQTEGQLFCMSFDVKDFEAEDISVTVEDDTLIVQAKRRTERDGAVSTKEFNRKVTLPKDVNPERLSSTLTSDGILTIEAQVPQPQTPPPDYRSAVSSSTAASVAESGFNGSNAQNTGIDTAASSAAPSSSSSSSSVSQRQSTAIPLDTPVFTSDPSAGRRRMDLILDIGSPYKPEDITVKVQGKRLIVEAVHEEKWQGRTSKVSMQRDFDLSENIEVSSVKALLKSTGQLTITAFAK